MRREHFLKLVGEALDSLPGQFRARIHNVAVLVEDLPREETISVGGQKQSPRTLILGVFHGVPMTKKSIFDLSTGPDYIVLYQKNIEAVCSNDAEVREQVRRTVIHEVGHYFGLSESELEGV
jgi:predicted Zn-dependent protease with MMP-like domain